MNIPDNLKYTKEHEWVRLEGDVAVVGITDFAQGELGDIVFVEVETVDETLDADEVFGTVEAVKTVSDLFLPVAGEIVEFNEAVEDDPALVNNDPYGEGWLIKVKVNNPADVDGLLDGEAYKEGAAAGGTDLAPAQKAVGYKASGARGSAPDIDAQGKKARLGGRVYQFADKYGGNIDEYSPIWTPETRAPGGDVYEPGLAGLAVWFIGFTGLLLTGGFAIYTTSALAN